MNTKIVGLHVFTSSNSMSSIVCPPIIGNVCCIQPPFIRMSSTPRHKLGRCSWKPRKLSAISATLTATTSSLNSAYEANLGGYLTRRLVQIGVSDVFSVPGDFNLILLDSFVAEPGLNLIGCCNELNAGYAADGYARSRGVGACVVTFTVGGLSVLNAIAGAYSESIPLICIVGGPNSNDYGTNRIIHHTIGLPDFSQELRCFEMVTCYQV